MPKRYGKRTARMLKLSKYADAYAKRYDPCAKGVLVHSYPRGTPGYELEVITADGHTIGVYTVGHAQLMLHYANTKKKEQK